MKKSRIFLASATIALAVSAVFATKANKAFAAISTGFINVSGTNDGVIKNSAVGSLMTNVALNHQKAFVALCTALGTRESAVAPLYTTATGTNPVYIH